MSKRKAEALQQKSPAEFFAENKNIQQVAQTGWPDAVYCPICVLLCSLANVCTPASESLWKTHLMQRNTLGNHQTSQSQC